MKNETNIKENEMKKVTVDNFRESTNNEHVLFLLARLLELGDNLVFTNSPIGKYVCDTNWGVVQRLSK